MSTISTESQGYGVSCRNINVSYGHVPLFEDFSLDFVLGECTCLLGPSGCGKSTLIRIISGTKALSYTGKVFFQGDSGSGKAVAWMSQKDLLLPWLTVMDNILLGAKLRGEVDDSLRTKALGMLRDAGMESYSDNYPGVLSGGMRQRVALLRTLMEDRPVILMDEPFSALDALTRLKLQDLSARLTRGKTVIMVTHDPMEALRLGNRIVVLGGSPARVVADMTPEGSVPRKSDSAILSREYPRLLTTLMAEVTT